MTEDPNLLQRIQSLQFRQKDEAESLLLGFLQEVFSADVAAVELRPLAVSLNSFNGFITLTDGKRYFFKTHTEPDTLIHEYYNAGQLADAGYPIIKPVFSSTEVGKQVLIYEVIESQSVFDVAWAIENGEEAKFDALEFAQHTADDELLSLYLSSMQFQSSEAAEKTPIHQLFYHRLTGGRLDRFYAEQQVIKLPLGQYTLGEVRSARWDINSQIYDQTLDELIQEAILNLQPAQQGISVIGHGDAHNGNVFLQFASDQVPSLLYFDPAFAGRHNPLLDIVKPLFHNVFAMWMYFPQDKKAKTPISHQQKGAFWYVDYDYPLPEVRKMFLRSKVDRVLLPLLKHMKSEGTLPVNWRTYLKSALFCCPLLTMNLADNNRFPPEISLLGLAMAVEMGAESQNQVSIIDQVLNEVSDQL
ncbi:MAG: hypothetical protein LCI00_03490 [Chloroflexi bacterium]|nr:hypothetical protein [Chloroflexota bacterium]MCC6891311.1 hypothetical protein [Anaerolineae bacterium]